MPDRLDKTGSNAASESTEIGRTLARIGVHSGRLLSRAARRGLHGGPPRAASIRGVAKPFVKLGFKLSTQPDVVMLAHLRMLRDMTALWAGTLASGLSEQPLQVIEPDATDRRFRDAAWQGRLPFNYLKQAYLLGSRQALAILEEVRGLDPHTRHKLEFYTGQLIDAIAPSNSALTNPAVLRATRQSRGVNLLRGLANLLRDYDQGEGPLPFRMTDPDAFAVGDNLANTPGEVVFQNDLMQLIQYRSTTEKVHRRPLLVIPPWINKYYILDLGEKKSFVRYWVEQGHTVFIISWVNPDADLAAKSFEDYMLEGPLAAMDAVELATGEREMNVVGYCIGGTLLGCTLAWLAARGDERVQSATFLNSLLEFSEVGDLAVFIDDDMLQRLEKSMDQQGYLAGSSMATAFNMLRANDLIWSFYVRNYLLGEDSTPFDLLYWNCDATRMPAAMHSFYLRNMYQHNRLREPGSIELAGEPIDLGRVKVPCYFASAIDDHIAPWTSCYQGAQHLGGSLRFVLGGSGHIAGIINPPARKKYGYRVNDNTSLSAQAWLAGAEQFGGSWWPDWVTWAQQFGGGEVAARTPGDGDLPIIEPAPGSYVQDRPAPVAPIAPPALRSGHKKAALKKTGTS